MFEATFRLTCLVLSTGFHSNIVQCTSKAPLFQQYLQSYQAGYYATTNHVHLLRDVPWLRLFLLFRFLRFVPCSVFLLFLLFKFCWFCSCTGLFLCGTCCLCFLWFLTFFLASLLWFISILRIARSFPKLTNDAWVSIAWTGVRGAISFVSPIFTARRNKKNCY